MKKYRQHILLDLNGYKFQHGVGTVSYKEDGQVFRMWDDTVIRDNAAYDICGGVYADSSGSDIFLPHRQLVSATVAKRLLQAASILGIADFTYAVEGSRLLGAGEPFLCRWISLPRAF